MSTEENLGLISDTEFGTKYRKSRIKEVSYTFNFSDNNVINVETERINGILKSIIVDMGDAQNIKIVITLKNYPFVKIMDANLKLSSIFYPVVPSTGIHGTENITPVLMEWVLNDILSIYMEGPKGAEVKVVMRYG